MVVMMTGSPPSLLAWHPASRSSGLSHSARPFAIAAIDGKGLGWVATCNLELGARIHAEAPLVVLAPAVIGSTHAASSHKLVTLLDVLPGDARDRYFDLVQNTARYGHTKTAEGVWRTNAMQMAADGTSEGLFLILARANHSCDNNAVYKWNSRLGQMTVHAVKRIAVGAEIAVSYGFAGFALLREQRRQRLRDAFGFNCMCSKCALSGSALAASEARLSAMSTELRFLSTIAEIARAEPSELLEQLEERYRITQEEAAEGYYYGVETLLARFCNWADEAHRRLAELVWRQRQFANASQAGLGPLVRVSWPGQLAGEVFSLPCTEIQVKVAAYASASRNWAARARDVWRDVAGEDSPTYIELCAAIERSSGLGGSVRLMANP